MSGLFACAAEGMAEVAADVLSDVARVRPLYWAWAVAGGVLSLLLSVLSSRRRVAAAGGAVAAPPRDSTFSMLARGFALRRKHAARLDGLARELHGSGLKGRTVLLTGSARGLGSGIAAHLAAAGAKLVLPLRTEPDLAKLRDTLAAGATAVRRECAANTADRAAVKPVRAADVSVVSPSCGLELGSLASIERFVAALASAGVVVDVLVNNAGMVPVSPKPTADGFEQAFGINYLGTVYLTQLLLSKRVLAKGARVVNVSSEEHRLGSFAEHAPYILVHREAQARACKEAVAALRRSQIGLGAEGAEEGAESGGAAGAKKAAEAPPKPPVAAPTGGHRLGEVRFTRLSDAMGRYAYSKLLLTTHSHELHRRREELGISVVDVCPGPVASEIARDAPLVGALVQWGMRLAFPSPTQAALPVLELAVQPPASLVQPDWPACLSATAAVHYHMSEPCKAGGGADDPDTSRWLWEATQALLKARGPPPPSAQ